MTAFRICFDGVPVPTLFLPLIGVAYGGGALVRAASQSNGTDDDIEGVSAGERCPYDRRVLGVEGIVRGDAEA